MPFNIFWVHHVHVKVCLIVTIVPGVGEDHDSNGQEVVQCEQDQCVDPSEVLVVRRPHLGAYVQVVVFVVVVL